MPRSDLPLEGSDMTNSLEQFKSRALSRPEVQKAYDAVAEEFALLDDALKARAECDAQRAKYL